MEAARDLVYKACKTGNIERLEKAAAELPESQEIRTLKDDTQRTPLHVAAESQSVDFVSHLVEHRACEVDSPDEDGDTPLIVAAANGNAAVVDYLLSRGASPRAAGLLGGMPIHRAASSNHAGIITTLIKAGSDVDAPSKTGAPLTWAAGSGSVDAIKALLDAGADANYRAEGGIGALLMAAAQGTAAAVSALLAAGCDPNAEQPRGFSCLHAAADRGEVAMVRALLDAGADVGARDEQGNTPPEVAAINKHRNVVEVLLERCPEGPIEGRGGRAREWTVDGLMAWGDEYRGQQKFQQAGGVADERAEVPAAEEPDKDRAAERKREGDAAFVGGKMEEAIEAYTASLRHDTSLSVTWANRAACRLRVSDWDGALTDARTARTIDATNVKAWYREGMALRGKRMWQESAEALYEAMRLEPDNATVSNAFKEVILEGRSDTMAKKAAAETKAGV
ncbi:unnamed protein product [Pedinophyceae sp. YPF-701]|nr:unnamed protein product [Pedinophyceae sp. YPF-701]